MTQLTTEKRQNLDELIAEISRYEEIVNQWDKNQQIVVERLKEAIESLHKEALTRIIKTVKKEALPALREAVQDDLV